MNARLCSRSLAAIATATLAVGALAAPAGAAASAPAVAPATTSMTATTTTTTGSMSANLTIGSVTLNGTKGSNVTCTTKGTTYTVKTSRTSVNGHQITGNVVVRNYTGPGTYTATVSLSVKGPKVNAAGAVKGVQVTIGDDGGSWSFTKTASGTTYPKLQGKTVSGTLSYVCNA